jgi:hypothetical protein
MRPSLFVLWAIVGWCATPWLWYPSYPDPDPDPWPLKFIVVSRIIGVVAGIAGGLIFMQMFDPESILWIAGKPQPNPWIIGKPEPDPWMPLVRTAASTLGAFLGAHLFVDIYGLARSRRNFKIGQRPIVSVETPRM